MKTISVKQVAGALNLTPRAVIYRLEKGQLKGTQTPNAFGKQEWRVYPTKEILEGLKTVPVTEISQDDEIGLSFSPDNVDVIDADAVADEQEDQKEAGVHEEEDNDSWHARAKDTLKSLAEELVRPLTETICAQQAQLTEKDRIIQEKDLQLKLLPDLQKQAEDERKAAELKTLESIALQKQIAEMEAEKKLLEAKATEASILSNDLELLKSKVEQLQKPWWRKLFKSS